MCGKYGQNSVISFVLVGFVIYYGRKVMEKNIFNKSVFQRKKFPLGEILTWILLLFLCYVVVVFYCFSDYFEAVAVDGDSMLPTYNSAGGQDTVYVHEDSFTYGDVVLIDIGDKVIIKRVIGLPGDQIQIKKLDGDYRIFRNGTMLKEDYINDVSGNANTYYSFYNIFCENQPEYFNSEGVMTVGFNEVFALGDNRGVSKDSSVYGNFDYSQITGKVFYAVHSNENPTLSIFLQLFFPIFYI